MRFPVFLGAPREGEKSYCREDIHIYILYKGKASRNATAAAIRKGKKKDAEIVRVSIFGLARLRGYKASEQRIVLVG